MTILAAWILGGAPVHADDFTRAMAHFYAANPTILAAEQDLRAENEAYAQARDAFGPQVSVNFEADHQRATVDETNFFGQTSAFTTTGRTTSTYVDLSQPLFSSGRLTAQVTGARADVLAQREVLRGTMGQGFHDAIEAYADVARDQAIITATRAARDLLERDLSDMEARFENGAATIADRAEVIARLAAARTQVAAAEGDLRKSRALYLGVIGEEPGDPAPPESLPGLPLNREAAVAAAESENPGLRQAVFTEASLRAKVAVARSAFGPEVSLRLSAQSIPLDQYVSGMQDRNLTAGVVVKLPVFTSGAATSQLRQARDEDRGGRLKVEAARRSAVQAAEQAFYARQTSVTSIGLITEQLRADRTAYESLNEQFKSGLISTIDLLNSEQELANTEVSLANARHDGLLAQADLLEATGRLEPGVLIPEARPRDPEADFRKTPIVAARLPTALLARALDGRAPTGPSAIWRPGDEPPEKALGPPPPESPLDDMDPARVGAPDPAPGAPH
jgi:outer membrane protein